MFPDRVDKDGNFEVPKMLIFAKNDSHAEDIIDIVREEFAEENKFCKKITYQSKEDPKTILSQFRNDYYPRIAVTVDMIATGTDIRPLEVLLFMRDVKSRSYYEQMKGRGTRTCTLEELKAKGTPSAKFSKDHFVIIDAIGVESSQKTDSRPLEKAPGVSLKDLLQGIAMGNTSEENLTSLANRLLRLEKQITEKEKLQFSELAGGITIPQLAKQLLNAHDPDVVENLRTQAINDNVGGSPSAIDRETEDLHQAIIDNAVAVLHNPELRNFVIDVRKKYDQIIDTVNLDEITKIGWNKDISGQARSMVQDFESWIAEHRDEITALQLFYSQPYRRRELTYKMIKDLYERLLQDKPLLKAHSLWDAYATLEDDAMEGKLVNRLPRTEKPKQELVALVSLVRKAVGIDEWLTAYDSTVDRNFQAWAFKKQAGAAQKFTEEQMQWLRMIKDFIATSFHVDKEDFDLSPFNAAGGLGKFYQLFGNDYEDIINELNEVLAA